MGAHLALARTIKDQQAGMRTSAIGERILRAREVSEQDLENRVGIAVGAEHVKRPLFVEGLVASTYTEYLDELGDKRADLLDAFGYLLLR